MIEKLNFETKYKSLNSGKDIISRTDLNGGMHCDWPVDGIGHR